MEHYLKEIGPNKKTNLSTDYIINLEINGLLSLNN